MESKNVMEIEENEERRKIILIVEYIKRGHVKRKNGRTI